MSFSRFIENGTAEIVGARLHLLNNLNQVQTSHVIEQIDRELRNVAAIFERNFEQIDKSDLFALVLRGKRMTLS